MIYKEKTLMEIKSYYSYLVESAGAKPPVFLKPFNPEQVTDSPNRPYLPKIPANKVGKIWKIHPKTKTMGTFRVIFDTLDKTITIQSLNFTNQKRDGISLSGTWQESSSDKMELGGLVIKGVKVILQGIDTHSTLPI
jgi:hypothetical protein